MFSHSGLCPEHLVAQQKDDGRPNTVDGLFGNTTATIRARQSESKCKMRHTVAGQTRGVCPVIIGQVVLWVLVLSSVTIFEYVQHPQLVSTLCIGVRVGESASEIVGIVMKLATSAQEWRNDFIASLDLTQAF